MAFDYDTCKKWGKILTFFGSGVLIIISFARFFDIIFKNPIDYIVIIYMILLGVVFILAEIPIGFIINQFGFLQYYLGKAGFALFLGLLSFNQHKWFTILNAVILWIICVLYIILGVVFFNEERAQTGTPNQAPPQPSREVKVEIKENAEKV